DLRSMSEHTRSILNNADLIAINQDPLGRQGYKIKDYGEFEVYYKPLTNGDVAICLFNRFNHPVEVELNWKTMNVAVSKDKELLDLEAAIDLDDFIPANGYSVRNLWNNEEAGTTAQPFKGTIAMHDV